MKKKTKKAAGIEAKKLIASQDSYFFLKKYKFYKFGPILNTNCANSSS